VEILELDESEEFLGIVWLCVGLEGGDILGGGENLYGVESASFFLFRSASSGVG
jgi:hypothetical protein